MRTNLKVNSEMKGTLKMKNKNLVSSLLAGVTLMLMATVSMSFTTEDTTRASDSSVKSAITKVVNTDKGDILKYTPASLTTRKADMVMDANFRITETKNRKMAVVFTKMMSNQAVVADVKITEQFNLSVLVPAFTKMITSELETADASMDVKLNEEAEVRAKISSYKAGLSNQVNAADQAMDVMMNISTIKMVKPVIAADADKQIDVLLNSKNISPSIAADADSKMDAMINK